MKYNCLRTTQYVKMFVVGLLLYFGETVFFKCSEETFSEETFTVYVKTLTGATIEVPDCKGTDMLSDFMLKFEEAYDKVITSEKIKDFQYNLIYNGSVIAVACNPKNDKPLADLGIGKNSTLHFTRLLKKTESYSDTSDFNMFDKDEGEDLRNIDENIKQGSRSSENLLRIPDDKKKEGSATSTCPLRRCCRICGC